MNLVNSLPVELVALIARNQVCRKDPYRFKYFEQAKFLARVNVIELLVHITQCIFMFGKSFTKFTFPMSSSNRSDLHTVTLKHITNQLAHDQAICVNIVHIMDNIIIGNIIIMTL